MPSQQNLHRQISSQVIEIRDAIMRRVTGENRAQMFGEELFRLYSGGTGKTLVNLCLLSDCLRIAVGALYADGVLSAWVLYQS